MSLKKFIQVHEPHDKIHGAKVTYSTPQSRKTFVLPRPQSDKESAPVGVESFALDPHYYLDLMKEVESLYSKKSK